MRDVADRIRVHDREADLYDRPTRDGEYFAPDALFGLGVEYLRSGDGLRDLGIGTGLASLPFVRAGVDIHGLDCSAGMLKVCRSKNFARDLNLHEGKSGFSDRLLDWIAPP